MVIVSGIYVIRNKKTDYIYIGSSQNIRKRLNAHRASLKRGAHSNIHIQRSWDKHGEKAFEFKILERCEISDLLVREQFWIDRMRNGKSFNISVKAGAPMSGLKHKPETLERMAKAQTGRKHSAETRAKIGSSQKGRKLSESQIALMRITRKGRKASEETKAKLRAIHANPSAELRYKMGNAMRGKKRTPESIAKYAEARSEDFIVTNPDGVEIRIRGLARFCRDNGLDQGTMSRVIKSGRKHKGWQCRKA